MSIRVRPEGKALANVVEAFLAPIRHSVAGNDGSDPDVLARVAEKLTGLHALVSGFEFAQVVQLYCKTVLRDDMALGDTALRAWLKRHFGVAVFRS